jgi:hypothetical protein
MKLIVKLRPVNALPSIRFTPLSERQNLGCEERRFGKEIRNCNGTRRAHYPVGLCARCGKQMLKITQDAEIPEIVRVSLTGHFTGQYVPEVEKALVKDGKKSKKCALDLMNVTFVDRPAMEFLRAAQSRKIKLENLPSYVKRWIQQEAGNGASHFKAR